MNKLWRCSDAMLGIRTITTSFLCFTALAAEPDYFPLQPGNQWVYRCSGFCGEEAPVLGIARYGEFNGKNYSLLKGFHGSEAWLRQDDDGVLWAFDAASGQEARWYSFFASEGESFQTSVDPCATTASIASRNAEYDGPAGRFANTLRVVYAPGQCADAGLAEEFFLPRTGLLRRSETTIGGPRTYDLIYSRIGGVYVIGAPHLSVALSIDRPVYYMNLMPPVDPGASVPTMTARLTLRNTTDHPIQLAFPSGQRYELEIRNEKGEVVYRWSDGKAFPLMFGEETFGPGERNYTILVRLADKDGKPLPPGNYVAAAWITTEPRLYDASVSFEIQQVF